MGKKNLKAVGRFLEPSEEESDRMAAGEDKATASRADLLTKTLGLRSSAQNPQRC